MALSWRELDALASRHENVTLVDPADFFCESDTCGVSGGEYGLYWDTNHITASASRDFAEAYLADPARYTRRLTAPRAASGEP